MTLRRVVGVVAFALFTCLFWATYPYVFNWSGAPHRELVAIPVCLALLAVGTWLFNLIYPPDGRGRADAEGEPVERPE